MDTFTITYLFTLILIYLAIGIGIDDVMCISDVLRHTKGKERLIVIFFWPLLPLILIYRICIKL